MTVVGIGVDTYAGVDYIVGVNAYGVGCFYIVVVVDDVGHDDVCMLVCVCGYFVVAVAVGSYDVRYVGVNCDVYADGCVYAHDVVVVDDDVCVDGDAGVDVNEWLYSDGDAYVDAVGVGRCDIGGVVGYCGAVDVVDDMYAYGTCDGDVYIDGDVDIGVGVCVDTPHDRQHQHKHQHQHQQHHTQ